MRIRRAEIRDQDTILALVHELALYEKLSGEVEANAESLGQALFCPDPKVFCDLVEEAGEIVGFSVWFYTFSTFKGRHGIWLEDLYIQPAHRGHGLGKALLVGLAQRCAAENLGRLEWSVLDWNTPSIGFYQHIGARLMDQWTNCRLDGAALTQLAAL
nr:GNAT family N-acetyltransferase [Beijerinckia indica]